MRLCFQNALKKSCPELVKESFEQQVVRLKEAGYPDQVLVSVAKSLLKKCGKKGTVPSKEGAKQREKTVVIPYIHGVSHNLKRIASKVKTRVVFSAPDKLENLCKIVTYPERKAKGCKKKHQVPMVACAEGVVYRMPLTCGKAYVGQTGRCLNERLREHRRNMERKGDGNLVVHCQECKCVPSYNETKIVSRNRDQTTREIIEAMSIADSGVACVSSTSLSLLSKEKAFLQKGR